MFYFLQNIILYRAEFEQEIPRVSQNQELRERERERERERGEKERERDRGDLRK